MIERCDARAVTPGLFAGTVEVGLDWVGHAVRWRSIGGQVCCLCKPVASTVALLGQQLGDVKHSNLTKTAKDSVP